MPDARPHDGPDKRPDARPGEPVVKTPVEARQAVKGHGVRYVLGFGLAGVIVAFIVVYLVMWN